MVIYIYLAEEVAKICTALRPHKLALINALSTHESFLISLLSLHKCDVYVFCCSCFVVGNWILFKTDALRLLKCISRTSFITTLAAPVSKIDVKYSNICSF